MTFPVDQSLLAQWFEPIDAIFERYYRFRQGEFAHNRRLFFPTGRWNVLFVAHLDTVHKPGIIFNTSDTLCASGIDDRVGCWLAYELGLKLGADVLLCDKEEAGHSTAQFHKPKDYNWAVEFDRAGLDVVMYFPCRPLRTVLSRFWTIGSGAFSDISFLPAHFASFNLGIGNVNPHGRIDHLKWASLSDQLRKFLDFFDCFKEIKFTKQQQTAVAVEQPLTLFDERENV